MRNIKKSLVCFIVFIILNLTNNCVYAYNNIENYISLFEYSTEFKEWTNLSTLEKEKIIQPKLYNDLNTDFKSNNPLYSVNLLGSNINSKFSLKDVIPNSVKIKNQYTTNCCWAFAGLSSLETNLALNKNSFFDFSERHVNYSVTRNFLNNSQNEFGYNRLPSDYGNWLFVESYLTNGLGAISESEMPFENNSNIIDIDSIKNKKVNSKVCDIVYFANYNKQEDGEKKKTMDSIKQHITNYGSVFASIHGEITNNILSGSCYNNNTGAKYCNNSLLHGANHAVSIIGWDDNYSIDNFSEGTKPNSNGAWLIRNSWGEFIEYDLNELKNSIFEEYTNECKSHGWYSASEIPNSLIEDSGYIIEENIAKYPLANKGYMYVSYEDCNIGSSLYGITKALDYLDYDYLYKYNELYPAVEIMFNAPSTYICNVFNKQSAEKEYIKEISLNSPETCTCTVYVNANGIEKNKESLQLVKLKSGDSETINSGYHTIEFANPIEINSDRFAVVIKIEGTRDKLNLMLEGKIKNTSLYDYVKTEKDKCFISSSLDLDSCTWFDLGKLEDYSEGLINGDSSMKVFTVSKVDDISLNRIEIINPPKKVDYIEGENFDKSGIVIKAVFNNGTEYELNENDYIVEDGNNLKFGQGFVTIKYQEKTVKQKISVSKKEDNYNKENVEEKKASNSKMDNLNCNLKSIQAFYYKDDSSKNYTLIDTEILGIERNLENDSYEYYYYLSKDGDLKNIKDWIKINEKQNNNDKISFIINSKEISNYNELSKENNIFIYIKESVVKGGDQSVKVSKAIKFEIGESKIETYVDNAKTSSYDGAEDMVDSNDNIDIYDVQTDKASIDYNKTSNTASPTKLPYTGNNLILIFILFIIIGSIILFIKFEVINNNFK